MRFRSDKSSCRPLYPALAVSLTTLGLIAPRTVASSLVWRRALRRAIWLGPHAILSLTPLLPCFITATAFAQQQTAALESSSSLPDAPLPQSGPPSAALQTPSAEGLSQRLRHGARRKRSGRSRRTGELDASGRSAIAHGDLRGERRLYHYRASSRFLSRDRRREGFCAIHLC